MDIQSTKMNLINWLSTIQDPEVLNQLMLIKSGQDWWNEISEEERSAIDEGILELDQGKGIPHEEVMNKMREKFKSTTSEQACLTP